MIQQMAIYEQGCKLIVRVHLSFPNEKINLSGQDAGQTVFRF